MAYVLENRSLEVQVDHPEEKYHFSRFDWTGKISSVKYRGIQVAGVELPGGAAEDLHGKGFYNEFGIDEALAYEEAPFGGWFHKIGIGLLKKDDEVYRYNKSYQIEPLRFKVETKADCVEISCQAPLISGYAYELRKKIELLESGFRTRYFLQNTGEKAIRTSEYNHNFIGIQEDPVGENYELRFPFELNPGLFRETIHPERTALFGQRAIRFQSPSEEQFFFSYMNAGMDVPANWEIRHLMSAIACSETGDFVSRKVNLWGWKHVISPELFVEIQVLPGQSVSWCRTYSFREL